MLNWQERVYLKPTDNIFFMNYPKQNAYLRVKFLDDNAYDVFDYVWILQYKRGTFSKKVANCP